MNSSYFAHLISRRYPQKLSSAQAKRDAGFRVKAEGELKATTLKEGIKEIEIKLSKLEAELFGSSEKYKELVRLENCWKRLQIDADKIKINNNKNYRPKKKRRIDEEDNISKEVSVEHIIMQESVGERDKFNQLQQILLDNQEKHTEFMKSTKDFAERIMKKICHFHETSNLRKKSIKPMSSRGGQHSEKDEEELRKTYGIGASLLSKKGGEGNLPKALGRSGQGITSPITALRGTRTPQDKSGIWTDLDAPISKNSKKTICFQRAHQTTESSSSTSSGENGFITPFGVINFDVRDDCQCIYIIAHNKICSAYFGSYGIVVCPQDDQYAYKLLFCQDNSDGVAQVLVDGNSRKVRRSCYKDAIYERRICDKLAKNVNLKKFCILVNGKFNLK